MKESHAKRIFHIVYTWMWLLTRYTNRNGIKNKLQNFVGSDAMVPTPFQSCSLKIFSHNSLLMWMGTEKEKNIHRLWLYSDYIHTSYMGSRRLARTFSSSTIFTYSTYANLTKSKAFKLQFVKYYVGNRMKPNQTKCETVECGAKCLWLFHLLISFSKSFQWKSVNSNENEVFAFW